MMWATSKPGEILIRDKRIEELAELPFLENVNFLIQGNNTLLRGRWYKFLQLSLDFLRDRDGLLNNQRTSHDSEIKDLLEKIIGILEINHFSLLKEENNPVDLVTFTWLSILSEIALHYKSAWWPSDINDLVRAFVNALTDQKNGITDDQYMAISVHMTLQLESPTSPSSVSVRKALAQGASLFDALRVGIENFWVQNHGLASRDLANLLHTWQEDGEAIEYKMKISLEKGVKFPGFGSHAHRGAIDPRMGAYKKYTEAIRSQNRLWESAETLKSFMKSSKTLDPNPDYYMALMHIESHIKPDRVPLTFLIARIVGWSAAYLEYNLNPNRVQ